MQPSRRRPLRALVAWSAMLVVGFAFAFAAADTSSSAQELPEDLTREERLVAATLYANQCATCHGANGLGGDVPGSDELAPPLADRGTDVTVAYVDLVLRTGRMPPAGDPFDNRPRDVVIDGEERRVLVAYLADIFDLPGDIPDPPPGDPRQGRILYDNTCAHCHGATGAGGIAGGGAATPRINHLSEIAIAEAIRVGPFEMPAFERTQLSEEEVGDIAAFLRFVDEEEPTPFLGVVELNPVYASGLVFILAVIMLVSLLWIAGKPAWFPDPDTAEPDEQEAKAAGEDT